MYSPHKHSYLQSRTQNINPRIINRCVNRARNQPTLDESDIEPPFHRLTSEQPGIPIEDVDVTRRPCAFGRWAVPILRRELHHPNEMVVLEACTSFSDLCHDPERGYEAISLRVPDRMADLLLHKNPAIRERACMALTVMAGLADGRDSIVRNKLTLRNIGSLLLYHDEIVRMKAALLVEMITRTWMAADELICIGFLPLLLKIVNTEIEKIAMVHLESLRALMYGEGKDIAFDIGAFEIFVEMMERHNPEVQSRAAYCLMMITSISLGKEMAYDTKILTRLNVLLHYEDEEVYTAAASAIMFCTIKSRAKIRASEIPGIADRLLTLMHNWYNPATQIFTIKALTNICEHPMIREYVLDNYCEEIANLYIGEYVGEKKICWPQEKENLKLYKETLLRVLNCVPWNEDDFTCKPKVDETKNLPPVCHCVDNYIGTKSPSDREVNKILNNLL